jgi:heme-degrading monooxygenase HmoA
MIIREWRARALPDREDAYPRHFRDHVIPELRNCAGFLGAHLSRRLCGDRVEFLLLTRWQSMDAVHAFAGASAGRAVLAPGAVAAVVDFDDTVTHYEVVEEV